MAGAALVTRRPAPALAAFVSALHDYATDAPMPLIVEPASLDVPIIVTLSGSFRIAFDRTPDAHDRVTGFASGLHAGTVAMAADAGVACVQINLTPLGARLVLRQPMDVFAGCLVPLDALGLEPLAARLADCATPDARLALAEAWVSRRIAAARADEGRETRAAATAFRLLARTHGQVRIDALADRIGWSRKRLAAQFRAEFGLTPKPLARILRFRRAAALAAAAPRPNWADIAAASGYSDQAHLVREYGRLAGRTPAA